MQTCLLHKLNQNSFNQNASIKRKMKFSQLNFLSSFNTKTYYATSLNSDLLFSCYETLGDIVVATVATKQKFAELLAAGEGKHAQQV